MKNAVKTLLVPIWILFLLLLPVSCQKETALTPPAEPAKLAVQETELEPVASPRPTQALVTFLSGDVFWSAGGDWEELEIGAALDQDTALKTGEDAYCELQFGSLGVIRIEADTQIVLENVVLDPAQANVGVKLAAGSVLNKVNKLTGGDRYAVKSQAAVCGVRGTEFGVTVDESGDTTLAVKEGQVTVLPANVDVQVLKEQAEAQGGTLVAAVERLEETAPLVKQNEEVLITLESLEETEEAVQAVSATLTAIAAAESVTEADLTQLNEQVAATGSRAAAAVEPPRKVSPESSLQLAKIDKIKLVEIPVAPAAAAEAETAAPSAPALQLEKIAFLATPREAEIFINGEPMGRGKFSGLFAHGETLNVLIRSPGYLEHSLTVVVAPAAGRLYDIQLEQEPEAETPAAAPAAAAPAAPAAEPATAPAPIAAPAAPPAAAVVPAAAPSARPSPAPAAAPQQQPEQSQPPAAEAVAPSVPIQAALKRLALVNRTELSEVPLAGSLLVTDERIYAADRQGTVYALNRQGRTLWTVATRNTNNENASPVLIDGNLFFSGANEFLILNAATGREFARLPLEREHSHLFGRHAVAFGQYALFPTNNSVRLIERFSAETRRELSVPGGSRMTPAVYRGSILTVNQEGVFLVLDPADGSVKARIPTGAVQPTAVTVSVYQDRAYFAGRKGRIVCIDLAARRVVWERDLPVARERGVFHDLEVGRDGVFAYSLPQRTVYGLSLATGDPLFTPIRNASSPPLYAATSETAEADGRLYLGLGDGQLGVFDTRGVLVKEIGVGSRVITRPVQADDRLFVGTGRGEILEIDPQGVQ